FARTLEHVLLAHMADPQALRAAVRRLPGDRLEASAAGRIAAALDLFADPEATLPPTLPASEHVRAHATAALAFTRGGRWSEVSRMVERARRVSEGSDDPTAVRAFAALANNLAQDLRHGFD